MTTLTKAHHGHQVTVAALNVVLKKACEAYKEVLAEDDEVPSLEDWCTRQSSNFGYVY